MRSDLIDVSVFQHHETDKAILVSEDGDRERAVWLPKAACEIERKERGVIVVTMPERLAIEKGLV